MRRNEIAEAQTDAIAGASGDILSQIGVAQFNAIIHNSVLHIAHTD